MSATPTRCERGRPVDGARRALVLLACMLACGAALLARSPPAWAGTAGNASAAAGFIEQAQNADGGFGNEQGQKSDPTASLWAAVALLAAGKNPADESVKNGQSLQQYLTDHESAYASLRDLGLLTIVQAGAELPAGDLGGPAAKLRAQLTATAAKADPEGGALGILGLIATGDASAKTQAASIAQSLEGDAYSDGGWGQGESDSVSTALVLQALAVSGAANARTPAVTAGVAALGKAQGNDGSIAISDRSDLSLESGDVASTAFTAEALQALGLPPLRNSSHKTVLVGLTQYQQKSSGGLCDDCAYYSTIHPQVTATAQAFPAFDGIVLPPKPVAASTSGPSKPAKSTTTTSTTTTKTTATPKPKTVTVKQVSSGTATQGVSGNQTSTAPDQGAFQGATAQSSTSTTTTTTSTTTTATTSTSTTRSGGAASHGSGPPNVTGQVVNAKATPKLVTVAGQSPGGLSAQDKAGIVLGALLLAAVVAGWVVDTRRPRSDPRSPVAVGLQRTAAVWHQARVRGALAPAAVVLIGAALVLVPVTTQMFARAPKGAVMISAFRPYMTASRLARYHQDVNVLNAGVSEAAKHGPKLLYPQLKAKAAKQRFDRSQSLLAPLIGKWPGINRDFQGLVGTVRSNRQNYQAVAALPSFRAFPWFFVIPGGLLIALGAAAVAASLWRRRAWPELRWVAAVIGAGLLIAPAAFSMWSRAPAGARMVSAFRGVENHAFVTRVQDDFGQMAILQGALGGQLVPALHQRGLSSAAINHKLPGVTAVDSDWVRILHDFTPLLGVMSDNVPHYRAVAALPSFDAFPWLFVIPGALVLAIVVSPIALARRRAPVPARRPARDGGDEAEDAPAERVVHEPV